MELIFAVEQVRFAYPGQGWSLDGISFTVERGERIALLGANGSGKSTLLHLLDGLYFPQAGTVTAFGQVLTEEVLERTAFGPRFRQAVGFLFQNPDAQLFCPTVEDELAFAPLQLRLSAAEVRQRIEDTLDLLEIAHLRQRSPQSLSGGEKKRVALASLLVVNPAVLLLDEPTAGLDPRNQAMLLDLLEQLNRAGVTCITATQDLALVPHLADRALVLSEAHRLVADGPVAELLADTPLLHEVNLIHAHRHRHRELSHTHPHLHILGHDHPHAAGAWQDEVS